LLNSDSAWYGGGNLGNDGFLEATAESWREWPASLVVTLPPLAAVVLEPV
jgi:1,4-alpha-glucan branching enzyme